VLDRLVAEQVLRPFDHRNLNIEIAEFQNAVPTTENLAAEVDRRLRAAWAGVFPTGLPTLAKIRIRETDRNICEVGSL